MYLFIWLALKASVVTNLLTKLKNAALVHQFYYFWLLRFIKLGYLLSIPNQNRILIHYFLFNFTFFFTFPSLFFFFNLANFYNYWIYVLLCIVAFNLKYVRRKSSSLIWQTLIIWTSNNFKVNEILCYGFSGAQKIQYWWKTTDYYSVYLYPLIFLQTSYLVHGKANLELC